MPSVPIDDDDAYEWIRKRAAELGVSESEVVRQVVAKYLEQDGRQDEADEDSNS